MEGAGVATPLPCLPPRGRLVRTDVASTLFRHLEESHQTRRGNPVKNHQYILYNLQQLTGLIEVLNLIGALVV